MSLESAALVTAPNFQGGLDMNRPEQHLVEAFLAAKKALFASLPPGAQLDAGEAKLSMTLVQQQIEAKQSAIVPALNQGRDLDFTSAISLPSDKCRQYYVGKYVAASQGLGGYTAGLGRDAIQAGVMTQQEYVDGMHARFRAYSEIIHAGETGQLVDLVHGEKRGGNFVVDSQADRVIGTPGVSGLGELLSIGAIVLIGIIAIAIVGGTVYYLTQKDKLERSIGMMTQFCAKAVEVGNTNAIKSCSEFAKEANTGGAVEDLIGAQGREQLLRYLGYGLGAYFGVTLLLPVITEQMGKALKVK